MQGGQWWGGEKVGGECWEVGSMESTRTTRRERLTRGVSWVTALDWLTAVNSQQRLSEVLLLSSLKAVPYHLVDSNDSRRKASDIKISFPVVVKQIRERVSLDTVSAVLAIDEHDTPRMVCLHRLCQLGSQLRVVVWSDYPDPTINQMSRGIDAGSLDAEHDTLDTSQLRVFFKM